MNIKQELINEVIRVEGGYVDDPDDSGGETNFGITVSVARAYGYDGPMVLMPFSVAFSIYEDRYWTTIKGDQIASVSEGVAREVFDTGVNMGVSRAGKILQRSLSVFNLGGTLYPDLTLDGIIGSGTLTALGIYLVTREEDVLIKALNCLQGARYIELAESREKDERFVYGWINQRVEL